MSDLSEVDPQLVQAINSIDGKAIEADLISLAAFNGTQLPSRDYQPVRYATNRVALTEEDINARRQFVGGRLDELSVDIYEHPMGIVGGLIGRNPDLPPVVIMSHTDTVPEGDMYDGVYGVLGGLAALEAIDEFEIPHERDIYLVALTGEESSGFGTALFGSKAMLNGLSEELGNARLAGKPSIAETILARFGKDGLSEVRKPLFGGGAHFPLPFAAVELHVEQNDMLEQAEIDLGVVDRIAAPIRYEMKFGESNPLEPDTKEYAHVKYFELTVNGKADHSGARPMGERNRADGLVETARIMKDVLWFEILPSANAGISIGTIDIEGQALNKVPGVTKTVIRVTGSTKAIVEAKEKLLRHHVGRREAYIRDRMPRFDEQPIAIRAIEKPETVFFDPEQIQQRQFDFFDSVVRLNELATYVAKDNVVGTVGTVNISNTGVITAGVDVRGVDAKTRDEMFEGFLWYLCNENSGILGPRKAGDSDPVIMDPSLVELVLSAITSHNIGTHQVMFSAAGHDAQNTQRAGIPTTLIFVPSEKGIAHNPDAYTKPEHLAKGVRALLATVVQLANR